MKKNKEDRFTYFGDSGLKILSEEDIMKDLKSKSNKLRDKEKETKE